jgi:hypothetical protein
MALIKCPECGKEVSDMAATCSNCAYPINKPKQDETVKIRMSSQMTSNVRVINMDNLIELWSGRGGQVAVFKLSKPTQIGVCWGIGKPNKIPADRQVLAYPSKNYSLEFSTSGFLGMTRVNLVQVDII